MRKLEVRIRQIIWALNKSLKVNNWDEVMYNGKKYYAKSSLIGNDIWDLYNDGEEILYYKNGKDLRIIHSWKRFKRVFKEMLYFQKSSWGLIDQNKPLFTRLSYKNSEDIKF